ncbi:MAG: hypothetical protein K6T85_06620 [Gorillibacterium sp.]|nr:hypothetical protein [Gorillibacterium sp.]
MKKINLANRKEYILELQKSIEIQQHIIALIESYEPITFEQKVCHKYVIEGSVKNVSDMLNMEGYRIEGRKYTSNDISAILIRKPTDDEIHEIAKKAFADNKFGIRYLSL